MTQQPGAGLAGLLGGGQQGEGPGQAAAGAGGRGLRCIRPGQGGGKGCLQRTGLVIRQGQSQGARGEAAIGLAEQQGAGGAIDGDGTNPGPKLRRETVSERHKACAPALRVLEDSRVGGGELCRYLTIGLDQGQPQAAGAQIDPQSQGPACWAVDSHDQDRRRRSDRQRPQAAMRAAVACFRLEAIASTFSQGRLRSLRPK